MELNGGLVALLVVLSLILGCIGGFAIDKTKVIEVEKPIITEKVVETECPACPEVICESADSDKLDDLWENLYLDEIEDIKEQAEDDALDELEEDNYEVIEEYLRETITEGVLDEIKDVNIEDTDIDVINLGLSEDEDKIALVTFEIEVEYTLEEGISQDYKVDLDVVYKVTYDEGNFNDELVTLVEIV